MSLLTTVAKLPALFRPSARRIAPDTRQAVAQLLKQSRTFELLLQGWQQTQGVPRPETIATFADFARVYKREVWVFACVSRIAQAAADVPIKICQVQRDGTEKPVDGHPLGVLLNKPNPHMGRATFMEHLFATQELMGNSYLEKVRSTKGGPPMELYPLRPDRTTVIPDPKVYVRGFFYMVNGRRIEFPAEDVVHVKSYHPSDDYYGLSTLEAAALSVEVDQYSISYNRSFFKNNAMPAGIFKHKTGANQDAIDRIKTAWESLYKGAAKAHKVGFLDGDWEWIDIGMKQKDAQFIDGRKMSREEILATFGVPPVLVGIFEFANYANSKEQQAIFWEVTMLPRLQRVEDQLTAQLATEYGPDLVIRFDTSGIEALKEDEDAKTTRVLNKVNGGLMSPNEGREELGLEKRTEKGMDMIWVPFGRIPIDQAAEPPEPAPDATDPNADPSEEGKAARRIKTVRWQEFNRDVTLLLAPMASALRSFFVRQRQEVMERFQDAVVQDAVQLTVNGRIELKQRVTIEQVMFDLKKSEDELQAIGRRHLVQAIELRGRKAMELARQRAEKATGEDPFNLEDPRIIAFLEAKLLKFRKGINDTTREAIRQQLVEGERLGEGITQISDRINEVFNNANQVRSLRIAQTEIVGAANFGALAGMEQSGVVSGKQWLSARDGEVRDSHLQLDKDTDPARGGRPVALMAPFSNGLMFPGDQSGPVEEAVNCRCVLLEVIS